jgi:hypothetical protein
MSRQGKDPSRKSRKVSAARGPEALPVNQSTGAPLIIAVILIAAIAVGLGYSVFKRTHEPGGIAVPATTSMGSAAAPVKPDGSAAPADSAAPQKQIPYGTDLTN